MTPNQQRRFYFPLWNAAANHHGWIMIKGRLIAPRPESDSGATEVEQLIASIWAHAETLAQKAHRAITADDLRHACHIVALGKDKSSADITSKELDRLADLFRLLAQPDSIDLMRAWLEPEIGQRKRQVLAIRRYAATITGGNEFQTEPYICKIAEAKFGARFRNPFWEDLDLRDLTQLAITLSERARDRAARSPSEALAKEGNPY